MKRQLFADGTVDDRPDLTMERHAEHVQIDPGVFITEIGEWRYYKDGKRISEDEYQDEVRRHYSAYKQS